MVIAVWLMSDLQIEREEARSVMCIGGSAAVLNANSRSMGVAGEDTA
jgi:hypothetical protein